MPGKKTQFILILKNQSLDVVFAILDDNEFFSFVLSSNMADKSLSFLFYSLGTKVRNLVAMLGDTINFFCNLFVVSPIWWACLFSPILLRVLFLQSAGKAIRDYYLLPVKVSNKQEDQETQGARHCSNDCCFVICSNNHKYKT